MVGSFLCKSRDRDSYVVTAVDGEDVSESVDSTVEAVRTCRKGVDSFVLFRWDAAPPWSEASTPSWLSAPLALIIHLRCGRLLVLVVRRIERIDDTTPSLSLTQKNSYVLLCPAGLRKE